MKRKTKIDYILLLTALGLAAFGLVMIASASAIRSYEVTDGATNNFFLYQQGISLFFGIFALIFCTLFNYKFWQKYSFWFFILTIVLLVSVYIPGLASPLNNSSRWISVGSIFFQPSEIAKLSFIIYTAHFLSSKGKTIQSFWSGFLPFTLLLILVSGLVIIQPDLGTATIFILVGMAMYFVSGPRISQILALISIGVAGVWLAVKAAPYRLARIITFFNPSQDVLDNAYHSRQALIAIGSGGLWGLGFGNSIQKYNYLPDPMSDSIFAVIAEEMGFIRTGIIFLVLVFFVWRAYQISKKAPDDFSKLLALGITTWFATQIIINIAAMLGVLPLTGIPLPFISYGGSALIINLAAVGILLNISRVSHEIHQ
ncbi:putative lipid II flippase FtsW [Patescibacteria group bacterium]